MRAGGVALVFLFVINGSIEARTHRYRRHHAGLALLQPFLLAHSAIHTVATAPIRVAYQTTRLSISNLVRGEILGENDSDDAVPAAYYTSRFKRPSPPHAERAEPMDDDDALEPRQAHAEEDVQAVDGARPIVSGSRALLRRGIAAAPASAPAKVKNAIWATNSIRGKPYIWGGGHGSFNDRGYDCSGTVSFALHHAGLLSAPLPSSDLMRFGERGRGRWITIYSRPGHTFATIAGLRLDTTDFQAGGNVGPRWHTDGRDTSGYIARHPYGL